MSNVGKLVRQGRLHKGLSQTQVAESIHKSLGYICDIERGRRSGTPYILKAIGKVLGIRESVLYDKYVQDATEAARLGWNINHGGHKGTNTRDEVSNEDEYANAAN